MTAVHALLAAWLVLYAGVRSTRMAGCFNIENPDLPERSHERTQMALARVGSPDSVPLALPCMGDFIGLCGNSGRSPQPHLHLHVQISEEPGSPTAPFHLCSVMVTPPSQATQHRLTTVPTVGSALCTALEGDVRPLYLLPGLAYAVSHNGGHPESWRVWCEIDAQSRLNLVSSRGARCAVESTWAVFACYARNAVKDPWFDQWLLACGYTPVSMQATAWSDVSLPARFLPMATARWCAALLWPWAAFASSTCERVWDAEQQAWKQQTRHRQQLTGISCTTVALLTPQLGCSHIHATVGEDRYILQATHSFQRSDLGVPAWKVPVRLASLPG